MSRRLANKARYLKRKRERTGHHPTGVELEGAPPTPDPWKDVPESRRKVVKEALKGGMVRKTYVDTAEDHNFPAPEPKANEAEKAPKGPSRSATTHPSRTELDRFAHYAMPGHEKPD